MGEFISYLWDLFRILGLFAGIIFFIALIFVLIKLPFESKDKRRKVMVKEFNDEEQKWNARVQKLVESGMSEKDAIKKVTNELLDEYIEDSIDFK